MKWLTVDRGGRVKLWAENKPSYFADTGSWARPTAYAAVSTSVELGGWPELVEYAASLDLKPGLTGIAAIDIEMTLR